VFALVVAPALARAEESLPRVEDSNAPMSVESASHELPTVREFPVNEQIERVVGATCRYLANVSGSIREVKPSAARPAVLERSTSQFVPNLSVEASLDCPNAPVERVAVRTLSGVQLDAAQLAQTLSDRAAIAAPNDDPRCAVRPQFAILNQSLRTESVERTCHD
jgi:hypothetical protein